MKYIRLLTVDDDMPKEEVIRKREELVKSLPDNLTNPKWVGIHGIYPDKTSYVLEAEFE